MANKEWALNAHSLKDGAFRYQEDVFESFEEALTFVAGKRAEESCYYEVVEITYEGETEINCETVAAIW